ncbi:MAG: type II secretion system GspH family protein [Acidobacteriota bacterium]|nr:type II secretion system GspH family protein [Acidobacteriota bacterium]
MLNKTSKETAVGQGGFSLLELLVAMTITLAVMAAASTLLAGSLRTRTRENARSNALASAQRALNMMSREIGNSGYGLNDNGIVVADSDDESIRVRANLNNNDSLGDALLTDVDEDVRFVYQEDNEAIVRVSQSGTPVVLATNITFVEIKYLNVAGLDATPATAERVQIDLRVELPAGPQQPAGLVRLVSDVALRNAPATLYQF